MLPYIFVLLLLAISNGAVEHVHRASPNMQVMELALNPVSASEDVDGCQTSEFIGHMIVQVDNMVNCHGPATVMCKQPQASGWWHEASLFS